MLKISPKFVNAVINAEKLEDLFPLLQNAIELEHATIPPYLTALFSFKPNTETAIRSVIHSIVIEEMLHMSIAANILNALGGEPHISNPNFVPDYPTHLPMGISKGLIVGIEKYSPDLVKNVFMEIEEPEDPLDLSKSFKANALPTFRTIGEFYQAIQQKIEEIAPEILPGDPKRQVTSNFFDSNLLYPIHTKEDAINAINIIIEQGEGTSTSPVDEEGEIAHYYRFQELYLRKKLVIDPNAPHGYSYSGPAIPFDANNVQPMFPNTKSHMLPEGSEERRQVDIFNNSYSDLLNGLHRTFNGEPDYINNTIGVMFDLRLTCQKLAETPFPGKEGYTIGPTYEFITTA
ncbi:ferritin-like protein [Flavobacterium sp. LS1R49]|uniref:Ferritin-like protein n=1 Tax=Flavobacterium shii TaxID=2987687 RepID=A0A9X3C4Q9_9FLAO|nr:ferritin-like protein [Flavobacterium shii]MCV9928574.1 ferritin-like protein [Flavobacterium shii]